MFCGIVAFILDKITSEHFILFRVVMRREQVLKICLNHTLTKDIIYNSKDDKTWLFTAPDFSEGEIQHKQFCIRFKNAEIAQNFKKAIDSALDEPTGM